VHNSLTMNNGLINSTGATQCSDSNNTNPHVAARPVDDDFMNSSDSFPASMAQRIALILLPLMTSPPPPPPHKVPLEKLHGCSTVAARALRPSRQESQTAQRRPHGSDTDSSPHSCNAQSLCRLVHFISLSLRPTLAPCACSVSALLQFSSELQRSESALPFPPNP
jgi:hypothetical protein